MKKQFCLLSLLIVILSFNVSAQSNFNTFETTSGQKLVSVDIHNLLSMHLISLSTWESKIKSVGGDAREIMNGGVSYYIGSSFTGGIEVVSKFPDGITIMWLHSGNKTTIMDYIVDDLRRNYIDKEDGFFIYGFKIKDISYKVSLKREAESEILIFEQI